MRSSGADDAIKIVPVTRPTLEEALEYIASDELVEVTPNHVRIRKALLKEVDRAPVSRGLGFEGAWRPLKLPVAGSKYLRQAMKVF